MKEMNWQEYTQQITDLSLSRQEPEWMLTLRKEALAKIGELPLPEIERSKVDRWPLTKVSKQLLLEEEQGSVPAFDHMKDNPLIVQVGTTTVFEQLPVALKEQGVIFTDLFTAMQEHSELVQEAYMQKAVKLDEDKLTAFHTAFMNNGIFIYIPDNVRIEEPLEALFWTHGSVLFSQHILIVAGKHSQFNYLERYQSLAVPNQKQIANIVVEVIAKPGAKINYSAIDLLGEDITAYMNRRGHIMRDASIEWAIGCMNDGDIVADFDSDLVGNGSHSEVKVVGISAGKQTQTIDTRVTNMAPHSIGNILQHGVIRESGTLTFNGIGHILKGAKGSDAQQENRVLMLSDKARGDANPILLIDENDVQAGHAASVGRVDPEEMYYLMSRGLHKEEAERLVIRGFLGSVIVAIPDKETRNELVNVIEGKLDA